MPIQPATGPPGHLTRTCLHVAVDRWRIQSSRFGSKAAQQVVSDRDEMHDDRRHGDDERGLTFPVGLELLDVADE
ncbi:hypothetical protein BCR15_12955 [Tessaracoccus lapidicaptus]|uniref:Uncharacterized protein n=1 Tax=Tessaracoccus lapidicaptus TaxID=1427523 RepID=A0A1C0AQZ9_9ACTN|nr:hypothetical protein BKM78_03025 [Tessaracoccus sp. T2.5-30]OCL36844.1 hypothetical protein BCR15_12955 [Tessaracoccus lapidicaptus]